MSEEVIESVGKAIEVAGMEWLRNAVASRTNKFEAIGWADVPNEVFAKGAIDELRRLKLLTDHPVNNG